MEKIEKLLANLEKPEINKAFRENSKRRLVSYAKNETANELFIIKILKEILNPLKVSLYLKTQVRERLMNLKKRKTFGEIFGEFFDFGFTRILASGTIASLFFVNIIGFNTTSADIESRIFVVEGDVYLQSLGEEWRKIKSNEILKIGDKIRTWEKSSAEIYFYDNSVSRIAENTRIGIANLTTNIFEIRPTVLNLKDGRVWNQIFPGKSSFKIETSEASVNTKEGVFDIKISNENSTEIQVISKPIEIQTQNGDKINLSKIYPGTGVKSSENGIIKEELKKDEWTEENREKDKEHREKIVEKIEKIEIANSKNIEPEENYLSETLNYIQELKIHFFNKNSEKISEIREKISENLKNSDENSISEILNFLNSERQKLKILLPGDNLYEYKIYISEISLEFDKTGKTIGDIKIERLNEAHELLNIQDEERLLIVLENFSQIDKNSNKEKTEDENMLKEKLSASNDELFLLQSLENSKISAEIKNRIKIEKKELSKEINKITSILTKDEKIQEHVSDINQKILAENSRKVNDYLERINKFKSENGQKNTLHWILEEIPDSKESISLLYSLRAKLDGDLSFAVSQKIIKVRRSVK